MNKKNGEWNNGVFPVSLDSFTDIEADISGMVEVIKVSRVSQPPLASKPTSFLVLGSARKDSNSGDERHCDSKPGALDH